MRRKRNLYYSLIILLILSFVNITSSSIADQTPHGILKLLGSLFSQKIFSAEEVEQTVFLQAMDYYKNEDFQGCYTILQQLIMQYPDSKDLLKYYFYSGLSLYFGKQYSKSEEYFILIRSRNSESYFARESLYFLAKIAYLTKDYKAAISYFFNYSEITEARILKINCYYYIAQSYSRLKNKTQYEKYVNLFISALDEQDKIYFVNETESINQLQELIEYREKYYLMVYLLNSYKDIILSLASGQKDQGTSQQVVEVPQDVKNSEEYKKLVLENQSLQQKIQDMETQINDLKTQTNELNQQIIALKQSYESRIADLQTSLNDQKTENENLKSQLTLLTQENQLLKSQSGDEAVVSEQATQLLQENTELKKKVEELETENINLRSQLEGLKKANDDLKLKIELLESKGEVTAEMEEQLKKLKQDVEIKQKIIELKLFYIEILNTIIDKKKKIIDDIREVLESSKDSDSTTNAAQDNTKGTGNA